MTDPKDIKVPEEEVYSGVSSDDVEVVNENTKSLLFQMMSQLKIGMDLTRVMIPCDFLEPRSLLEKLTDFMTHGQILHHAATLKDPEQRMIEVTRWYLSGFHVKPKGVKKPYNPVLGEIFRANYVMEDGSIMTYFAEQVSHHPPISALYGECLSKKIVATGWYYPKSRFLGNSAAAMAEGFLEVRFLEHDEVYVLNWPNIYARGIIFGKLLMECVGNTKIYCRKTGYSTTCDFKAKPFFGGEYNVVHAKIKKGNSTICTIKGKWNNQLTIKYKNGKSELFFDAKTHPRIAKTVMPMEKQLPKESRRLWQHLSRAILNNDIKSASIEKAKVEDAARKEARELKEKQERKEAGEYKPKYFVKGAEGFWNFVGHNAPEYTILHYKDFKMPENEKH